MNPMGRHDLTDMPEIAKIASIRGIRGKTMAFNKPALGLHPRMFLKNTKNEFLLSLRSPFSICHVRVTFDLSDIEVRNLVTTA